MRDSIKWGVLSIWIVTVVGLFSSVLIHPVTVADISVMVRQVSLLTNTRKLFEPTNESAFIVAGLSRADFAGNNLQVDQGGRSRHTSSIHLRGQRSALCSFYHVRISDIGLSDVSLITLIWNNKGTKPALALKSHGELTGSMASELSNAQAKAGFSCNNVMIGATAVPSLSGSFSPEGGDSVVFSTSADARLDFRPTGAADFRGTNIPVLGDIRLSESQPGPYPEEKSVIIKPQDGDVNEVTFPELHVDAIPVNVSDIVLVQPSNDFYASELRADNGIFVRLRGKVRDVRLGPGATALSSRIPVLLDHVDKYQKILAAIPALGAFLVGIYEKLFKG